MNTVLTDHPEPGVTLVTLNRPECLNAMSMQLVRELHATLAEIAADRDCRVVVLTGAGRGFCSGHELADMRGDGAVSSNVVEVFGVQQAFASLTGAITKLPQPVIAAVNGPAVVGWRSRWRPTPASVRRRLDSTPHSYGSASRAAMWG